MILCFLSLTLEAIFRDCLSRFYEVIIIVSAIRTLSNAGTASLTACKTDSYDNNAKGSQTFLPPSIFARFIFNRLNHFLAAKLIIPSTLIPALFFGKKFSLIGAVEVEVLAIKLVLCSHHDRRIHFCQVLVQKDISIELFSCSESAQNC